MSSALSHFIVPPAGLRAGQTLQVALPAGVAAAEVLGGDHKISALGSIYSAPTAFTAVPSGTGIALTWLASTALPAGAQGVLVLELTDITSDARAYSTTAILRGLLSAGAVPSSISSVHTHGCDTVGDNGGLLWVWQSATPSWLASDPAGYTWIQDASPRAGYWVPADFIVHAAAVGAHGGALGADPATDERARFVALFAYLAAKHGGGTVVLGNRRHRIATTLTTVPYLTIRCEPGCFFDPRERSSDPFDVRDQPGFVLDLGASFAFEHHNTWENFSVSRPGLAPNSTFTESLDKQAALAAAGDLIIRATSGTYARRGVTMRGLCVWGGNRCFYLNNTPGIRLMDLWGDGNTFIDIQNSGESVTFYNVKQKNTITNGAAELKTIGLTAIADNGSGFVRLTADEDIIAAGLTTGQRIASDRVTGISGQRQTATVVSTTEFDLLDVAWAGQTLLSNADFSFQVGAASAVTALLDDGGKLRVQTAINMPFQVGHFALISLNGVTGEGFYAITKRTAANDFTLDVTATAPMLAATLANCELVAMPGNRTGWGIYAFNVDGAEVSGTSKGGNGVYIDAANWVLKWSHEGGIVGELDRYDPSKIGLKLAGTTTRFSQQGGAWKSVGIGCEIDLSTPKDVAFFGVEFEGSVANINIVNGGAAFFDARRRGSGIIAQGAAADNSDFFAGEYDDSNVTGTATQKAKVAFDREPGATASERGSIVGTEIVKAWVSGTATEVARFSSAGTTITPPGPYANDAAAAAAGIAVGQLYRVTGGGAAWRVT